MGICTVGPDASDVVQEVTQSNQIPSRSQWNAVPMILKYMQYCRMKAYSYKDNASI